MMHELQSLQDRIGYVFRDQKLLEIALTHASYGKPDNQRLEYLGDALLGLIISALLFDKHPKANEGMLTRQRAFLVKKSSLAKLARAMSLGKYIRVGLSVGDVLTDGMLADALEALVAAIYQEGGLPAAQKVVSYCYASYFSEDFLDVVHKDAKSALQEFCQQRRYALPDYQVSEKRVGDRVGFEVCVSIHELKMTATMSAGSKREAQYATAEKLLDQLQEAGIIKHEYNRSKAH